MYIFSHRMRTNYALPTANPVACQFSGPIFPQAPSLFENACMLCYANSRICYGRLPCDGGNTKLLENHYFPDGKKNRCFFVILTSWGRLSNAGPSVFIFRTNWIFLIIFFVEIWTFSLSLLHLLRIWEKRIGPLRLWLINLSRIFLTRLHDNGCCSYADVAQMTQFSVSIDN